MGHYILRCLKTFYHYIHELGGYRFHWHNDIEVMLIAGGRVYIRYSKAEKTHL